MIAFKLSASFLPEFEGRQPEWGPVGYVTYKRTYARAKDDGTREEFWETCKRVVEGVYNVQKRHCHRYGLRWDNAKAQRSAQEMYRRMWAFKWLPPGRGLWMMGAPVVEKLGGAPLNNPLRGDEELFTPDGLVRIGSLATDETVRVWTRRGWVEATARCYGVQDINRIELRPETSPGSRTIHRIVKHATPDHGWMLADGTRTHALKVGDRIRSSAPRGEYVEEAARHGRVFADGTMQYAGESSFLHRIRLCVLRLVTNAARNYKGLPGDNESVDYHATFIRAWFEFDGSNGRLDTTHTDAGAYLEKWAPVAGYVVTGVQIDTRPTDYADNREPLQRFVMRPIEDVVFTVTDIAPAKREAVYCLHVPGEHEFALAGGVNSLNCGFVSTEDLSVDLADPFCWLMDMSMLGVGVGFDTKGAGTVRIQEPKLGGDTHVVDDSREGWVELLRRVLTAYTGRGSFPGHIDYSRVRPAGTPIKGFGGTSSGPEPLKALIDGIESMLDAAVGEEITSTHIVDIANLIGKCVVSGNVRRSAEIAFGEPDDHAFLNLKNPDVAGDALTSHRWASNNSVFATVGTDYTELAALTARNGEPGYEWLENAQAYSRMGRPADHKDRRVRGANPCVEQSLEAYELCCLVETFPGRHESFDDYRRTLKYAYLYAKSVTLIPTHDQRTNAVMLRNRRIGASMSGIVQATARHGRRAFFQWCDAGYDYLRQLDAIYADWLCVRESVKITSVKPSGSVSLLPGVTPGIHFPHSEHYIRRIRFQKNNPLVGELRSRGYVVEDDAYSPNTVCVEFPVREAYFDRAKGDVSMWEQLELAAAMQHHWADNQVSITVTFRADEARDIKPALELYETRLKGVSFLPLTDHGYTQAPYEEITATEYARMSKRIRPLTGIEIQHDTDDNFCTNDTCELPRGNE